MKATHQITLFETAIAQTGETITLHNFISDIAADKWSEQISTYRKALVEDPDLAAKLKRSLPAVSISGCVTSGGRGKAMPEGRFQHSGLLQIDLDSGDIGTQTPAEVREILGKDPHVIAAWISPSKNGVKGIMLTPTATTDQGHKEGFAQAEAYIEKTYGWKIDPSTKDPVRLCFVGHDPDIVINTPAVVLPFTAIPAPEKAPSFTKSKSDGFPAPPTNGIHSWLMEAAWHCRLNGFSEADTAAKLQSYDGSLRRPLQSNEAEEAARTVFSAVPESAARPDDKIPADVFPVPAGNIGINAAAEIIFPVLGDLRKIFMRGTTVHEIAATDESDHLAQVSAERFCSIAETGGRRIARREVQGGDGQKKRIVWRTTILPVSAAKLLLEADAARQRLPSIRQLANCPVLIPNGDLLTRGYHEHAGGTHISKGQPMEEIPFGSAVRSLLEILADFDFATESDLSRAFASLVSPALKMGGWINDDFPLDLAEADQSQSGKTYRQKLVCRIYGETPTSIVIPKGGVGSIDESISTSLLKGRPFITLGNIRGKIDSTILEEALRGAGRVNCRTLRHSAEVDCRPFLWQLSTNGAELTRDLANRSIVTRIRKRPDGHEWKKYDEGDLESHVIKNQSFYLSCVFSIIRKWKSKGMPTTSESRHDFRGWCRSLDSIVQLCGLNPLLDGHREQQERTSNPNLQWLRDILLAAKASQHGQELYTHDLANIAEDHGIEFPGNPFSKDEPHIRAGRILGKIYRDAASDEIEVDGFIFTRTEAPDYSGNKQGHMTKKYTIRKP